MWRRKREEQREMIPLLDDGFVKKTINPSIDIADGRLFLGVWIDCKSEDSDEVVKDLWIWDGNQLLYWETFEDETGYKIKRPFGVPSDKRMSNLLILNGVAKSMGMIFLDDLEYFSKDDNFDTVKIPNFYYAKNNSSLVVNGKTDSKKDDTKNYTSKYSIYEPIYSTKYTNPTAQGDDGEKVYTNIRPIEIIYNKIFSSFSTLYTLNTLTCGNFSYSKDCLHKLGLFHDSGFDKIGDSNIEIKVNRLLGVSLGFLKITYIHLIRLLRFFLDFDNKRYYDLIAFYIMATYFFEIFDAFPYLFINGVKRSGKTTILKIMEKVCFNALMTGNTTASPIFRLINSMRPTLLIDEADSLVSKRNSEMLRNLLLNGYKKGGFVYRSEQTDRDLKRFDAVVFNVYCPKVIVNIVGIDDVLEDRTIYINIRRTASQKYSNRVTLIDKKEAEWQFIRDRLYISLFALHKLVDFINENFKNESSNIINNRDWELWKPILIMAMLCGRYEEMREFAIEKVKEKVVEDITEQRDNILLTTLEEMVTEDRYYKISDIKTEMKAKFDSEDECKFLTSRWIGKSLRRLGFTNKRRMSGGIEYFLSKKEVEKLIYRMIPKEPIGNEEEIDDAKEQRETIKKLYQKLFKDQLKPPEEPQESENPQEQPQDAKSPPSQAENNMIDEVIYNAHKKLEGEEEVPDWESITIEDMLRKNLNIQKHEEELFQQLVNTIEKARQKKRKGIEEKLAQIEKQAKEAEAEAKAKETEDKPQKESSESPEVEKEKPQTESKPQESPQKSGERLPSSPTEAPKIGFEPEESSGIPREVVIEKSGKVRKTKEIIDKILEILGWFNNETTIQSLNFELHAYENDYRIPDELFYKIIDWMIEKGLVYKPKPHLIRRSGY